MSGPSIRVVRDFYAIRVFINDLLHVHVPLDGFLGVHSWLKPKPSIEYVLRGGTMVTEYDDRAKWEMILCGLEGQLLSAPEKRGRKQQCKGKVRHETKEAAYIAMLKDHGPNGKFNVYLCPHCDGFHVGHRVDALYMTEGNDE